MKRRVAVIQPYFGTLPNYFSLALKSYEFNADFDWYIFTDDRSQYRYPPNVIVTYTTLDRLKGMFQQCFEFPIALGHTYKLCDYRPMYGHLFADQLKGYDFWGHFDPDVIFGNLNKFVTGEIYQHCDKVGLKGHFSLYRNTPAVNLLYQQKVADCLYYKDVITSETNWGFDERDIGINAFFPVNNLRIYTEFPVADIHFREYAMRVLGGTGAERARSSKSCFAYEQGGVYRYYWSGDGIHREEFIYIHLMKRKMAVCCGTPPAYLMCGNAFRDMEPITRSLLETANKNKLFYRLGDKLRFAYIHRIKPAWKLLFVERNYGTFAVRLSKKFRSVQSSLRKS